MRSSRSFLVCGASNGWPQAAEPIFPISPNVWQAAIQTETNRGSFLKIQKVATFFSQDDAFWISTVHDVRLAVVSRRSFRMISNLVPVIAADYVH